MARTRPPSRSMRSANSRSCSTSASAARSVPTAFAGAAAGANSANQLSPSNCARPVSITVGTDASSRERWAPVTARALSLPACTCAFAAERLSIITSRRPASLSWCAAACAPADGEVFEPPRLHVRLRGREVVDHHVEASGEHLLVRGGRGLERHVDQVEPAALEENPAPDALHLADAQSA